MFEMKPVLCPEEHTAVISNGYRQTDIEEKNKG